MYTQLLIYTLVWVLYKSPAELGVQCRLTTSELNIAPCEALQAVDQTGLLLAPWLWLLLSSV